MSEIKKTPRLASNVYGIQVDQIVPGTIIRVRDPENDSRFLTGVVVNHTPVFTKKDLLPKVLFEPSRMIKIRSRKVLFMVSDSRGVRVLAAPFSEVLFANLGVVTIVSSPSREGLTVRIPHQD